MPKRRTAQITGILESAGKRPENVRITGDFLNAYGVFTPTFTGFSSDPSSALVYWTKTGNHVNVLLGFGTGTSDAATFTITNWPGEIHTDTNILVPVGGLVDNGTEFAGGCISFSANSSTVSFFTDFGFSTWTASGAKGINNTSLTSAFSYSSVYLRS